MKNMKLNNGITLVSLVVTIVVMLILAGVSINLVIGDNGIIGVTKQIKNNTIQAESEAQEKINNLKGQETYTEDGTIITADENAPTINGMDIIQLTNNSFKVSVNVTEKESGIKEIRYSKDNGETYEKALTSEKSKSYIYNNVNSGTYQIKVQVEDNNGNFSEASKNFVVLALYEEKDNEMLNNKENTTLVINGEEITIPAGYKVSEDSADTVDGGIVITDAATNGNEWVWVPVPDASVMYETASTPIELTGGTGKTYLNGVFVSKYSKSINITNNDSSTVTISRVLPNNTSSFRFREPDVVVGDDGASFDAVDTNRAIAGFIKADGTTMTLAEMADAMKSEYDTMIASIEKYHGFYIGRYELTANGEKAGATLTEKPWYELYANCKNLAASDKAITRMIWGCQWDVTCNWIANYGDKNDINDSSSWGNYSNSTAPANTGNYKQSVKKDTGSNEAWKANNIYDFAGNCFEWTQEANSTNYRAIRGGYCNNSGSNTPASCRGVFNPPNDGDSSIERFSRNLNSATLRTLEREHNNKEDIIK